MNFVQTCTPSVYRILNYEIKTGNDLKIEVPERSNISFYENDSYEINLFHFNRE